jgi:hypothetical protein
MPQEIIQPNPAKLLDRLQQPRVTRAEALRQLQDTMPLTESAKRELEQSKKDSCSGPPATTS